MNTFIVKALLLLVALYTGITSPINAATLHNDNRFEKAEGESVVEGEIKEEGEGEPTPEGEAAPEGEPIASGMIAGVELLSPDNGTVIVEGDATVTLLLVAQVQIQDEPLDPTKVTVLFSIEDRPYQAAWHESGFFFLTVDLPSEPPEREEGEGEEAVVEGEAEPEDPYYQVKVIAYGEEDGDYMESALYEIAIRKGEDLDSNGYADDPFTALQETGDIWFRLTEEEDCLRTTAMKSMAWGNGYTSLFVQNPDDPDQVVTVWAPNALLEPEEYGVLTVSAACSPEALFAPYDTSTMTDSEPGPLSEGGLYVDASIIYSRDQGQTYEEVTPLRLATNPIQVSMNRIETRDGFQNEYYGYPTIVDSDIVTGIRLVPLTGQWSEEGVEDLGPTSADGVHGVNLYRLYAVAPFEVPFPGELDIDPDPTSGYNFGIIKVDHPITQVFTLTNVGGEDLQCEIELEDESGVFFLQGEKQVILEPDAKYELKIQFNPARAEAYEATVFFYGGEESPQVLSLTGRGSEKVKSIQPLGCGAGDATSSLFGDVLLGTAILLLLACVGKYKQEQVAKQ